QDGYKEHDEVDRWVAFAGRHIWQKYQPSLMVVHLANVDHVAHGTGPNSEETRLAVAAADKDVQTLLENVNFANTCVLIVGDHGFYDVKQSISPNVLFAQKKWLTLDSTGKIKDWTVVAHASG